MTRASRKDMRAFAERYSPDVFLREIESIILSIDTDHLAACKANRSQMVRSVLRRHDPSLAAAWAKWHLGKCKPGVKLLKRVKNQLKPHLQASHLDAFDSAAVAYLFARQRRVGIAGLEFVDSDRIRRLPKLLEKCLLQVDTTRAASGQGMLEHTLRQKAPQMAEAWRKWSKHDVPIGATGLKRIFDAMSPQMAREARAAGHRLICYYLFVRSLPGPKRPVQRQKAGSAESKWYMHNLAAQLDIPLGSLATLAGAEMFLTKISIEASKSGRPADVVRNALAFADTIRKTDVIANADDRKRNQIAGAALRAAGWSAQRAGMEGDSAAIAVRLSQLATVTGDKRISELHLLQRTDHRHVFQGNLMHPPSAAIALARFEENANTKLKMNFEAALLMASAADEACIAGGRLHDKLPGLRRSIRSYFEEALAIDPPHGCSEEYRAIRYWFCARLLQEGDLRHALLVMKESQFLSKAWTSPSLQRNQLLLEALLARARDPSDSMIELNEARKRALASGDLFRARQFEDMAKGKILPLLRRGGL